MMQGKSRLIFPLVLLVGSSGGAISSLGQLQLPSLSFGGGINFLKSIREAQVDSQELEIDHKGAQSLENKDYSSNSIVELETNHLDSPLDRIETQIETKKSQKDISFIFSELKKEKEVQQLDASSQSKVETFRVKLRTSDHNYFKKSLGKIQKFKENSSGIASRSARVTRSSPKQIERLSDEEKRSIKDFFKQFESLDREKVTFLKKLNQVSGESNSDQLTQKICLLCVFNILNKIGWTSKDLNLFDKVSTYRSNPINRHHYYSSTPAPNKEKAKTTWGQWNESGNPYYYFFDSEDKWLESVNKISVFWRSYYDYVKSGSRRFASLITLGYAGSSDKGSLERGIDDSKASLELEIGTKLMNIMRQLS